MGTITIRSSQKVFTEEEVSKLTGICPEHLRSAARLRNLGFLRRAADAAQAAGVEAGRWCYTNSDLMVVTMLHPRCQH